MTENNEFRDHRVLRTSAWLAVSILLLAGCAGTPPSRFYVLHSLRLGGEGRPVEANVAVASDASIGVGPVKIPEYLDRREIMTRTSPSRLDLAELDRWAEPLESNIARVVAEDLSFLLGTDRAVIFPWPGSTKVDYQVLVDLTRFEATSEGKTILVGQWSILDGEKRKPLVTRKSDFVEAADGPDLEAKVSAMSRLLGRLSREIASDISALARDRANQ